MHVPEVTKILYSGPTGSGQFVKVELDGRYEVIVSRDDFKDWWKFSEAVKQQTPISYPDFSKKIPREVMEAQWKAMAENELHKTDHAN